MTIEFRQPNLMARAYDDQYSSGDDVLRDIVAHQSERRCCGMSELSTRTAIQSRSIMSR